MSKSINSSIEKANERIKDLENIINNENKTFSDMASLVAFFQTLSTFMSLSLIKSRKKIGMPYKQTNPALKLDLYSPLSHTQNIINNVNLYFAFLHDWANESSNLEFLKTIQNVHYSFEQVLSVYYKMLLRKVHLPQICPTKIREEKKKKGSANPNSMNEAFRKKYLSCFNVQNMNSELFLPTKKTVFYLEQRISPTYGIKNIYEDSLKTFEELCDLYSDEKGCEVSGKDFLMSPRYDIVRENPQFQKFISRISDSLPLILTEFTNLNKSLSLLFSKIKDLDGRLKNAFALPQIDFDELHRVTIEETKVRSELLKVHFINNVFSQFNEICPSMSNQSTLFVQRANEKYKKLNETKDLDLIIEQLNRLSKFFKNENFEKKINDQISDQISVRRRIEEGLRQFSVSKRPPQLPSNSEQHLDELRNRTSKLVDIFVEKRTDLNNELLNSISKHIAMFIKVDVKPLFPYQIEKMMHTLSDQAAEYQWMNSRLEIQKAANVEHKEKIGKLADNLQALKREIETKKTLLDSLKMRNSRFTRSNRSSEICLCPHCRMRQRNAYISKCGHVLCTNCLKDCTACPICQEEITKDDICKVNWT
ncbi:hypothetical protein TRFO_36927 [Tritrichomonas foetus]|uniref:RING-type domain-containing protein n=1 Tax=Tritrichomonas foetus TaxID=1144522 RepID=A0A1J4JHU1_9EUKA|nr:hypothetical protein TRFO_36927 [Tritrichomonas foetus]|eukprot:OHS96804.1 hypothetical protein TRFO_36927 [Tritrichomonas foetus]